MCNLTLYIICDLKLCLNLEMGQGCPQREENREILITHGGKKGVSNISTVDQKHGTRVDRYSFLSLYTHAAQVVVCIINNKLYSFGCVYHRTCYADP
jgi:hypothetical protein